MSWTVCADVGGTFTDIVLVGPDGEYRVVKRLSSPPHFEIGVLEGISAALDSAGLAAADLTAVLHGTTVATNSVLSRTARPVALVTTEGFVDVLEIGRLRIPNSYDLHWSKPEPLAPRRLRLPVRERVLSDGSIAQPLDPAEVVGLVGAVAGEIDGVAVSFLNSYLDPVHEHAARAAIARRFPELAVSCGADLVREIGEVERTSTAVLNAYLVPVMADYLGRLVTGLRDLGTDAVPLILQSDGGMTPVSEAAARPAAVLESGPAAGVVAVARLASTLDLPRVVSFDMGGTTAKAALVEDGTAPLTSSFHVGSDVSVMGRLTRAGGYPVQLPCVDLAEVGAGGSSRVRVDTAGGVVVGPDSAGADPGPVCYGRGGTVVTVTDANVVLGLISADGLAHNGIAADVDAASRALAEQVAGPLGLDVSGAAFVVHEAANLQMARALRAVTTERGRDVRDYTLVAFGGSGPLHAATLAELVGMTRILVPPDAGVLSAQGLAHSRVRTSASETVLVGTDVIGRTGLAERAERISGELGERFAASGRDVSAARVSYAVDARYQGQSSELRLELGRELPDMASLAAAFEAAHKSSYGFTSPSAVVIVRLHVTLLAGGTEPGTLRARRRAFATGGTRAISVRGERFDAPVWNRADVGEARRGPCLVDDPDTTTFVPPGWSVVSTEDGGLLVERSVDG